MGKDNMSKITDIRTYMMGVAILCIMVFHTTDIFVVPKFMEFIQRSGYLGVDIFFFVSAYGLYYSMQKPTTLRQWYLRRLKRILPAFWIVSILMGIMVHWSLYDHLREETFWGFLLPWTNQDRFYNVIFWYIPAALLFYLIFPAMYKYRKWVKVGFIPIVVLSYVISTMLSSFLSAHHWSPYLPGFFGRIPVFLLGMIVAEHEDEIRNRMNVPVTVALVVLSLMSFVLLELHAMGITKMLSFPCDDFCLMAFSLPFICFVCSLLQNYVKILNPFILFCGRYSLEIYLLHVAFTWIVPRSELFEGVEPNYKFLGAFVLAIPCAYFLNKGLAKVIK